MSAEVQYGVSFSSFQASDEVAGVASWDEKGFKGRSQEGHGRYEENPHRKEASQYELACHNLKRSVAYLTKPSGSSGGFSFGQPYPRRPKGRATPLLHRRGVRNAVNFSSGKFHNYFTWILSQLLQNTEMERLHNFKELLDRRRKLRNNATREERILWQYLKGKQLGCKFRRQHSIGYFIVDFYCPEKKLVIEIDGVNHNENKGEDYDTLRDEALTELGFKTLRIKNSEIRANIENVIEKIRREL